MFESIAGAFRAALHDRIDGTVAFGKSVKVPFKAPLVRDLLRFGFPDTSSRFVAEREGIVVADVAL